MQKGRGKVTKVLLAGRQLIKRLAKSDLGKKLGGEALRHAFPLFEKTVSKIKNDKIRKVLYSYLANTAVNYESKYARNKLHKY